MNTRYDYDGAAEILEWLNLEETDLICLLMEIPMEFLDNIIIQLEGEAYTDFLGTD